MIDLKSQSQAMRLEKFGKGARDVGDSVLYHSLLGLTRQQDVWGHLSEVSVFVQVKRNVCKHLPTSDF